MLSRLSYHSCQAQPRLQIKRFFFQKNSISQEFSEILEIYLFGKFWIFFCWKIEARFTKIEQRGVVE